MNIHCLICINAYCNLDSVKMMLLDDGFPLVALLTSENVSGVGNETKGLLSRPTDVSTDVLPGVKSDSEVTAGACKGTAENPFVVDDDDDGKQFND